MRNAEVISSVSARSHVLPPVYPASDRLDFVERTIVSLAVVSVPLANFKLVSVGSFPIQLPHLTLLVMGILSASRAMVRRSMLMIVLGSFLALAAHEVVAEDHLESAKTFVQWVFAGWVFVTFGSARLSDAFRFLLSKWVVISGLAISSLVLAQAVLWNVLGSRILVNPLGPFSSPGPDGPPIDPFTWRTTFRPNATFSEPSAVAWCLGFILAIHFVSRPFRAKPLNEAAITAALISGMVLTLSASGFVNAVVLLSIRASLARSGEKSNSTSRLVTRAAVALILLVGLPLLAGRLDELSRSGSSFNSRISAPLELVAASLPRYPLGYPFGSLSLLESEAFLDHLGRIAGIHNSFILVIFHFGIIGLIATCAFVTVGMIVTTQRKEQAILWGAAFLAFGETGALWGGPMILMLVLMWQSTRHVLPRVTENS